MNTRAATSADDRIRDAHPAATLCLTALTVATVISLCRVFPDWEYLRPMLAVALGTHAVAFVLRVARAPVLLALPVLLGVIFLLIGVVYYRDTLSFMLPTSRTIEVMRIDLRLVIDQFATAVAPVPSEGNFATATAGAVALCAVLADTFAFRAYGRVEAIVPTGVLFIFTAALGTDNHRVAVAALWISMALLTIAVLRFDQSDQEATWMGSRKLTLLAALPAVLVTISLGAVAAGAMGPRLPGAGDEALIDTRNRQGSVTEVLSPLVDIRARMKNRGNSELFTVQSTGGPHYWRAISLPKFDGDSWSPVDEDLEDVGDRSAEIATLSRRVTQIITIKSMRGPMVPAAYHPIQVSPDAVLWAPDSETLILPAGNSLQRDDVVMIASAVPELSQDLLRAATVTGAPSSSYYFLPPGMPDTARTAAVEVTAGAATPFDKALALQNWFRENFTYDLDVQLDNSNDAIEAFLRGRAGFCQQFAGTFAAMARSIGLPARLAVGYTPGDLGTDGLYHVYGRHAHAWPEVWFDGIGWVAFEPTPGRGSPDGSYTGLGAAQDDTRGSGGSPTNPGNTPSVPDREPGDPDAATSLPGQGAPGGPGASTSLPVPALGGSGGGKDGSMMPLVILGAIVLGVLWILLAPRVLAAFLRGGRRTPRDRVVTAWYRACNSLSLAGAPSIAGETPLEYASVAEMTTGVDHRTLRELAIQVTRAVYSPMGIDDVVATRCETLESEVDAMCRTRTPLRLRIRSMVDPRFMRRRIAG